MQDINVNIKLRFVEEVINVLDVLDVDTVRKSHPNVKLTIEVADDAN